MPRFRRKVSEVVATQFRTANPTPIGVNIGCLPGMCDPPATACSLCGKPWVRDGSGRRLAVFDGDWILPEKDGSGFYPVAADKFDELYEPAEPNALELGAACRAAGLAQAESGRCTRWVNSSSARRAIRSNG